MNAPSTLTKVDRIRSRDGDRCWLCDGLLDFQALPNSKKSPTVEHLTAKANGGTNALDNLVLTHPGCNKQLGTRPADEKLRMKAKWRAARERARAVREVCVSTPADEGGSKPIKRVVAVERPVSQKEALQRALLRWKVWTALAAGAASLAVGFAGGMLVAK